MLLRGYDTAQTKTTLWILKSRQTFYQWRAKHIGPPAYRFGKLLRIDRDEFNEWAASHAEGNRLASDFRGGKSGEGK
ncbi:helix-turn-helix domain-containing protein [Paeniglutamicibacter antarcticus]|uniref:Helix-turn-helix domain-containing protein n=1 Tax=Arthrobacter terrae TaxID=2935737 RepID=A0A931CP61_9MICC|nr:helix-turn-helix domain-containing protein [Arthrobacter terrae]